MTAGEKNFSVIIPARNEEECLERTVRGIAERFASAGLRRCEILIVNDCSTDATGAVAGRLAGELGMVRLLETAPPGGFGSAVSAGLKNCGGSGAAIVMADSSESPEDVLVYYEMIRNGAECVFGSRFVSGARLSGYPLLKLRLNRLGNRLISEMFAVPHSDLTNAFKAYSRRVIDDVMPLESRGFEICVELPLKAVLKGYSFAVVPVSWKGRAAGESKFGVFRVSLRYLMTAFKLCFYRV